MPKMQKQPKNWEESISGGMRREGKERGEEREEKEQGGGQGGEEEKRG